MRLNAILVLLTGALCLQLAAAETFLDLAPAANMGFRDEVANDGKGGWSDQGPENDLAGFDAGAQDLGGVPFRVIDPVRNAGRAVLSFRGEHLGVPLQTARLAVAPPARARYLYLLHTSCWNLKPGRIGTITVHAAGGAARTIEVQSGRDVADWWNAAPQENGAVVYRRFNSSASVGLYLSRFDLGAASDVEAVTLSTDGGAIWIVVAATLSDRDIPLPSEEAWVARESTK